MSGAYYGRTIKGQVRSVVTNPVVGLNTYEHATAIGDNFLSDSIGVIPYRNDCIRFNQTSEDTLVHPNLVGKGRVYSAISDTCTTDPGNYASDDHLLMVSCNADNGDDSFFDLFWDLNVTQGTKTSIDISSYNAAVMAFYDMCLYATEAKRYVCYVNSGIQKLFYYDYTSLSTVDLPFYPKYVTTYANRLFMLDTWNKLWWCRAGDITSWYGLASDDDYLMSDVDMDNVAYTLTAQPDVPRYISFTVTKTSTLDTLGTLALVGTSPVGDSQSEMVTPIDGVVYSKLAYATLTSVTGSGWTAVAGSDKLRIGVSATANGSVQADAGMWTLESERKLMGLQVLSNNIYIWGETNIYIFTGYSPDTFSLQKIISDIGSHGDVVVSNNVAYFRYSGDIYEYNGDDYPRIISRPLVANGQSTNSILGGLASTVYASAYRLCADKNYLYLYEPELDATDPNERMSLYYYMFDLKARSWWRMYGFGMRSSAYTDKLTALYVYSDKRDSIYNIYGKRKNSDAVNDQWKLLVNSGLTNLNLPYITTKCYNTNPSETGTLTDLILQVSSGTAGDIAVIYVFCSLTESGSIGETLFSNGAYTFTGDIENIVIPVSNSAIARAPHYRLYVYISPIGETSDANIVCLYNIERRYRIIGRSR